jgi:hypothetical protein
MLDEDKIAELIEEVIDRKFGHLIVPPEDHHRDHLIVKDIDSSLLEFLKDLHKFIVDAKSTGWSTLIKVIIPGICALIIGGIILWFKTPIKNLFH